MEPIPEPAADANQQQKDDREKRGRRHGRGDLRDGLHRRPRAVGFNPMMTPAGMVHSAASSSVNSTRRNVAPAPTKMLRSSGAVTVASNAVHLQERVADAQQHEQQRDTAGPSSRIFRRRKVRIPGLGALGEMQRQPLAQRREGGCATNGTIFERRRKSST